MTKDELEVLIDNLPPIAAFTGRIGTRCVGFSGGPNTIGQILLDTGELVKAGIYVNGFSSNREFKGALINILLPEAARITFVGVGIWHK